MALCFSLHRFEIDGDDFDRIGIRNVDVIDVRELHEFPEANEFSNLKIPLKQIENHLIYKI